MVTSTVSSGSAPSTKTALPSRNPTPSPDEERSSILRGDFDKFNFKSQVTSS